MQIKSTQYEAAPTPELRIGDVVSYYGATLKVETKEDITYKFKDVEHGEVVIGCRAFLVGDDLGSIPAGWFNKDDKGRLYWWIQGNHRAQWLRQIDKES